MSRALLIALAAAVVKDPAWPKHDGKPYPCSVTDINTTNGTVNVIKLDDSFFRPQGGNQMVIDQLQAQLILAKEGAKHSGARVSTFYKDKDGAPRPGFQISIVAGAAVQQEQSVESKVAAMWSEVMEKMPEEQVDELAEKLSSKPDAYVLARLQRALQSIPKEEKHTDEKGSQDEEIPF